MKTGLDLTNCLGEQFGVFVAGAQDVKGEALRRLAADTRQLLQFVDEPRHRFGEFGQGTSRNRRRYAAGQPRVLRLRFRIVRAASRSSELAIRPSPNHRLPPAILLK